MVEKQIEKPAPFTGLGPVADTHTPALSNAVKAADAEIRPVMDNFRTYIDSMSKTLPDAAGVRESVEAMVPLNLRGRGFSHEIGYIEDLALIADKYRSEGNTVAAERATLELKNAIEGFAGMLRGTVV